MSALESKILYFNATYPLFLRSYNKALRWTEPQTDITIVILNRALLNDKDIFPWADKNKNVSGRFFRKSNIIFITDEALDIRSTDLHHELVHAANYEIGIDDEQTDEDMAYSYERYYNHMNM